jgi:hypothetical protein
VNHLFKVSVIIKFNKHGALASIEEGISGLVHISEFGTEAKMKEKLELLIRNWQKQVENLKIEIKQNPVKNDFLSEINIDEIYDKKYQFKIQKVLKRKE